MTRGVPRCAGCSAVAGGRYYDRAGRSGGPRSVADDAVSVTLVAVDHSLYALAHHPPSRRCATFGARGLGPRGESVGSVSRSTATVPVTNEEQECG